MVFLFVHGEALLLAKTSFSSPPLELASMEAVLHEQQEHVCNEKMSSQGAGLVIKRFKCDAPRE